MFAGLNRRQIPSIGLTESLRPFKDRLRYDNPTVYLLGPELGMGDVGRSSSLLTAMFIALLVLAAANSIKCQVKGAEIYEIDYKGPETHSFWPPPRSSRSGPRLRPLKDRADRELSFDLLIYRGNLVMDYSKGEAIAGKLLCVVSSVKATYAQDMRYHIEQVRESLGDLKIILTIAFDHKFSMMVVALTADQLRPVFARVCVLVTKDPPLPDEVMFPLLNFMKYLGLSICIKRLSGVDFQPMFHKSFSFPCVKWNGELHPKFKFFHLEFYCGHAKRLDALCIICRERERNERRFSGKCLNLNSIFGLIHQVVFAKVIFPGLIFDLIGEWNGYVG
ncbi:hypothetical protein KFK09_007344 [Dendrobium nobile]|uniref:Uncharacterized protein n=1 Tax=Dendrobium nobile TaxID=94219 RepID=A0A8T3BWK7_DENNO|nr:hypothetical protein KFK09_007344 [Dendrobium nobile]